MSCAAYCRNMRDSLYQSGHLFQEHKQDTYMQNTKPKDIKEYALVSVESAFHKTLKTRSLSEETFDDILISMRNVSKEINEFYSLFFSDHNKNHIL